MPDFPVLVLALVLVTGGAVVQGTIGFGYNILVVPLLALFIAPKEVVPTVILNNVLLDAVVLASAWREVSLRRIWLLILAGLVATPIGVLLLDVIDPQPIRVLIGLVVVLSGAAMLGGARRQISNERLASGLAGSGGGLMNGLVGLPGPPVILLFANQRMSPRQFRANIVTYFTVVTVIAAVAFWLNGALTNDVASLTAVTIPATGLGVAVGIALHKHVPLDLFYRASLVLVILAGATVLVAGLVAVTT
jgi:uncharacterized membrane protein YfcA